MGLLDILGGVSSIAGLFSANDAQRRAEEERQQAMAAQKLALLQQTQQNDQLYSDTLANNHQTLLSMAGQGGDQVRQLGSGLGDALANAGVFNSSATAGALTAATRDQESALAQLAAKLQADARYQKQQGLLDIGRQSLGVAQNNIGYANNDVSQARNDMSQARGGFASFLGGLVQRNLSKVGANVPRANIPQVNGTIGQSAGLPGNALPNMGGLSSLPPGRVGFTSPTYQIPGMGDVLNSGGPLLYKPLAY